MVKAKIKNQGKHHEAQDSKPNILSPSGNSASAIIFA